MCGKVSKHGHVRSHALTYLVQTGLKSLKYKHMWDALINIPREEGRQTGDGRIRIRALYRGLFATMIGEAPYAGLKFCMYEAMKAGLSDLWSVSEHELSPLTRVSCGALSGLMAVNVVYPLDVVRRRMQTHEGANALYKSPLHAIGRIISEEGVVKGLYRLYMTVFVRPYYVARGRCQEAILGRVLSTVSIFNHQPIYLIFLHPCMHHYSTIRCRG